MAKHEILKRESLKFDTTLLDEVRKIAVAERRTLSGQVEQFVLWALQDYNNGRMDPKGK